MNINSYVHIATLGLSLSLCLSLKGGGRRSDGGVRRDGGGGLEERWRLCGEIRYRRDGGVNKSI